MLPTPKHQNVKQILTNLKGEIDNKDFNIILAAMDRSTRQKFSKEMLALSHPLEQIALTDI